MHAKASDFLNILFLFAILFLSGCGGGGGSNSAGPVIPAEYVNLSGLLTAPEQIESSLLPNVLQNTDSQVRSAFLNAQVYVNGAQATVFSLTPLSSNPDWQFRISNVAKAADGKYRIEVLVGRINLKAIVSADEINSFTINQKTTAAVLLSDTTGISTKDLLASYPSFINSVEASLVDACKLHVDKLAGSTVQSATVSAVLQTQKQFFTELGELNTIAKLAYLQKTNDLDGDGKDDVLIEPNLDGTRIRIFTTLSSSTSMLTDVASISSYTDERLLQDFRENLTSTSRTFDNTAKNVALGLYFKKSASADVYLKLFIKRVDIVDGTFKGVVAEYDFVNAATTAITTGSKTFSLVGAATAEGSVAASNFLTDGDPGPYLLSFVSLADGLGCGTGDTRLVRAIDGQPELANLTYAEPYLEGGGNYYLNTTAALKAIFKDRTVEVGDVFSAYFPSTKNYALFKIKWIGTDKITVDYKVNAAEDEPRF
ncbi:MAG: hypothetical protein Kow0029_00220 [Candidatus Rifleibacteriota bacterium]